MRRDNMVERIRLVLGPRALELAKPQVPEGDTVSASALDAGIQALQDELAHQRRLNQEIASRQDRFEALMDTVTAQHRISARAMLMMTGQLVRELSVIRRLLAVSAAPSNAASERLLQQAEPAIAELRQTLALWREREGIDVPEYTMEKEEQYLRTLMHSSPDDREKDQGDEREI